MFTPKLFFIMHVSIKYLGIVESAEIELNGLTILTGNNDTGKSFIGKLIFSTIKTLKDAYEYNNEIRLVQIEYNLNVILEAHRTIVPFNTLKSEIFSSEPILNSIAGNFRYSSYNKEGDIERIDKYKYEVLKDILEYERSHPTRPQHIIDSSKKQINDHFNVILGIINEPVDSKTVYIKYFNAEIIKKLFDGQINSFSGQKLEISFKQGASILLSMSVENNQVTNFNYDSKNPIFQTDSTIIDSPIALSLNGFFLSSVEVEVGLEEIFPCNI